MNRGNTVRFDEGPLRCCCCGRKTPVIVFNPNTGENVVFLCEACISGATDVLCFVGGHTPGGNDGR